MKTPYLFMEAPPFTPPPSVFDTIKSLWRYALRPTPLKREHNVVEVKLPLLFQILLIELVVLILVLVQLSFVYDQLGLQVQESVQLQALVADMPFLLLFVTLVIMAPLKEELIFRLPLIWSSGYLVVALTVFLFHYGSEISGLVDASFSQAVLALLLIVVATTLFLTSARLKAAVCQLWKNHFGLVSYSFVLLFAAMHLLNFQQFKLPLYMMPLLVLPQFVGGIFLSYTRLRLGFGWAVAQHMFNNAVALLLLYGYLVSS